MQQEAKYSEILSNGSEELNEDGSAKPSIDMSKLLEGHPDKEGIRQMDRNVIIC